MISGSAARRAAEASVWLPEAIASSTLRMKVRMRLRRDRLISVRFAILRVIFLADTVLAMACPRSLKCDAAGSWSELRLRSVDCMETEEPAGRAGSCVAAYRREKRQRQRERAFERQKNAVSAPCKVPRQGLAGSRRSLSAIRPDTRTRSGRMIRPPRRMARRDPACAPSREAPAMVAPRGHTTAPVAA